MKHNKKAKWLEGIQGHRPEDTLRCGKAARFRHLASGEDIGRQRT